MNRMRADYFFHNGDIVDVIHYGVTTKLSLIDLLLEAREDPDFVKMVLVKR